MPFGDPGAIHLYRLQTLTEALDNAPPERGEGEAEGGRGDVVPTLVTFWGP